MPIIYLLAAILTSEIAASTIPLDTFGKKPWVLTREGEGSILPGFYGLEKPWKIRVANEGEAKRSDISFIPQKSPWEDFAKITEISPESALKEPKKRIWNLPDLLDRLKLEGNLPDSVTLSYEGEFHPVLFVHKPTLISVSFALDRYTRIINASHLVLICPLCDSVFFENKNDQAKIEHYSHFCKESPKKGYFIRYRLNDWLKGCEGDVELAPSGALSYSDQLPQVLISQMSGRKINEIVNLWKPLFKAGYTVY